MKIRSRMTGAALVLMLSMGGALAACGSDSDSGDTTEPTSTPKSTPDAEPEADSGSDGKPSRDDVIAGYTKIVAGTMGDNLPGDIVKEVVTCFADELYDTASAQTLQAIADADPAGVDPKDAQLFGDSTTTCTAKITG